MNRFSRMHLSPDVAMRALDGIDLEEKSKLAEGIAEALRKDSDGGAKITREEGKRILADARELVVVLARDIID